MRVAVTGAAGFIGSHLVPYLDSGGHDVLAIDIRATDHLPGSSVSASTLDGDLRDILTGVDAVVHLAGPVAEGVNRSPQQAQELERDGTRNVAECCRDLGIRRLVFASSFYVYEGCGEDHQVDETTRLDPQSSSEFARLKLQSEAACRRITGNSSTKLTILRFGSVYGPGGSNAVSRFIADGLRGAPIVIWGDGQRATQYTYVDDIASGIARCLRTRGGIFNLISPQRTTTAELGAMLETKCGFAVSFDPSRTPGPTFPYISSHAAVNDLDWTAIDLVDGVFRTLAALSGER